MAFTAIVCAFGAFALLIFAAAMAHYLDNDLSPFDDLDYDDDEPPCDGECDALGAEGECSKCGWFDHLAQFNAQKETDVI